MKRVTTTGSITPLFLRVLCSGIAVAAALYSLNSTAGVTVPFEDKGSITRSCTSFPSCRSVQTSHNAANQSAGVTNVPVAMTNAYYIFDLTGISGTVTSATFELDVTDIPAFSLGKGVGLFDVSTPLAFFSTSGSETRSAFSGTTGPIEDVLNDLGSGQQYGSFSLTTTGVLSMALSPLTDFNAAVGGHFILGLSGLTTLGASFGDGSLILDGVAAIPEPETYAILLAGLGVLGLVASRRKQPAA